MSFFDLEAPATGTLDTNPPIVPIPDGTQVLAYIEDAKVLPPGDYSDVEVVQLTWAILQPDEYKNRKIFHKVKVYDENPVKAKKQRAMLAAIDANAGGKIAASGKAPDDLLLMSSLAQKQMILKVAVWDMNGNTGNWVQAVAPKGAATAQAAPVAQQAPNAKPDDDVPF